MNVRMTFLAALLAVGAILVGGLAARPVVVGPVPDVYLDPVLADEWDEDAANWYQPGDYAIVQVSDRPFSATNYIFFGYLQSEDDWDENAANWHQPGDYATIADPYKYIAQTGYYVYGYIRSDDGRVMPVTRAGANIFGDLHNEDDWDDDAPNWEQPY